VFESLELSINHESLNTRSCDAEYFYSDHILTVLTFDSGYVNRAMAIRGTFDDNHYDSRGLSSDIIDDRKGHVVTRNGAKFRRYNFITPINIGIARDGVLLPPNIPYRFTFVRAKPERALMRADKDDTSVYTLSSVPLISPILEVTYVSSPEVESKMNRLKNNSLMYTDYPIRRVILPDGLQEHNVTLIQGLIYIFLGYF